MPAPAARPAHAEMNAAFDDTGREGDTHIYFDAHDTFGDDPLGAAPIPAAEALPTMNGAAPAVALSSGSVGGAAAQAESDRHRRSSYDFEQPSYFPAAGSGTRRSPGVSRSGSISGFYSAEAAGPPSSHLPLPLHHSRGSSHRGARAATPLEQARAALGRFGRLVGMRVPGATYASLQSNDDDEQHSALAGPSSQSGPRRAGIYGGGTNQDGVFANLSAKPERRRRRARDGRNNASNGEGGTNDNSDDRGSDDDLEDETLPPTYQAAAADAAPPYWETTILGPSGMGGALYPLAPGGLGWTPGGAQVGEVEDLILEGLPVGNFFGFAWNLAVSMCFQFVGFLLTYLLHTTHAAKCGSRAGLGVTLIQYGFYLHSRAAEGLSNVQNQTAAVDYSGNPNTIGNGPLNAAALFFGEENHDRNPGDTSANVVGTGWWGTHSGRRSLWSARDWSPEAFAAQGNADDLTGTAANPFFAADDANSASLANAALSSTQWFAYFLIMLGSFLLFTSVFQYWRVVRWGRGLVESSRRREREERAANEAATGAASTADASGASSANSPNESGAQSGIFARLRAAWAVQRASREARGGSSSQRSGEDWVVFPGMSAASRRARREAAGQSPGNATENVGDGLWWASAGPGRRLGSDQSATNRGGENDSEDDEAFGILGPQSDTRHYSPEERRLIHSLREAGMLG
ncbi:hypothetical protein OC835_001479 [Tilletia horrida]|nr:hypothetical protein OC835_001479 [Tilletia horrida]